jgi:hypothetical protein
MKKIGFFVTHHGELAAGIRGYTDEVDIIINSGDPGGELGEFEQHMQECLSEWFDGATVTIRGGE